MPSAGAADAHTPRCFHEGSLRLSHHVKQRTHPQRHQREARSVWRLQLTCYVRVSTGQQFCDGTSTCAGDPSAEPSTEADNQRDRSVEALINRLSGSIQRRDGSRVSFKVSTNGCVPPYAVGCLRSALASALRRVVIAPLYTTFATGCPAHAHSPGAPGKLERAPGRAAPARAAGGGCSSHRGRQRARRRSPGCALPD